MTNKKKILFTVDEMTMGGVARVLNTLMKALPEDQYEIDLLILHKRGMLMSEIPSHVTVLEGSKFFSPVDETLSDLVKSHNIPETFAKIRLLLYMKTGLIKKKIVQERKRILTKQYDVEVAAKEGFCTIFTAYGDAKKKINWVLTDYSVCNYSKNHMPLVKQALSKIDLNIADSEHALVAYETVFRVQNGITIHNLMETERIFKQKDGDTPEYDGVDVPKLIDVARFHPQKSIDRLLIASDEAYRAGYKHQLYLIGGGEQQEMVDSIIKERQMKHVVLLGFRQNPYPYMAKADLFVLSSLYEGFATVISESLIAGTPVLTTHVSGCDEQITQPEHGWIVENSQEGLTEGLKTALSDINALNHKKEILKDYHYPNEEILKQFMEVL